MNFTQEILKRSKEIRTEMRRRVALNKKLETLTDPTLLNRATQRQTVYGGARFEAADTLYVTAGDNGIARMHNKRKVIIGGSAAQ